MRYGFALLAVVILAGPAFAGHNQQNHHEGAAAANAQIARFEARNCPCDAQTQAKLDAWKALNDSILAH